MTTAALVPVQPSFTDSERLALAGFLAGYRGLTREAYALDLRQFTAWCWARSPDQRALPIPGLAGAGPVYACSFILTNLDVSAPDKTVAAEHWHGVRGGKAMISTLRWRLIAVPGRLVRHARHLILRLPPGHGLLAEILARLRDLPAPA